MRIQRYSRDSSGKLANSHCICRPVEAIASAYPVLARIVKDWRIRVALAAQMGSVHYTFPNRTSKKEVRLKHTQ